MLLREQRHEIHLAVVVQIDGDDVNAPGARIDRMSDEIRMRRIGGAVLEDRDLACGAMPERGDHEIGLAVAVEVGGFHVGDARPAVQPEGRELAAAGAAQPDDGAVVVI